ncbi:MAG TPA: M48 family metallopeptidase, partial [Polyangiaceae bacterium]
MTASKKSLSTEATFQWLEQSWLASALCCLVLAGLLGLGYFVGIPRAADHLAESLSMDREQQLGLDAMQSHGGIRRSKVPLPQREKVEQLFQELSQGLPLAAHYRLEFDGRRSANAFAFPGGTVVVTDGLLEKCSSDEVTAILAHEIGHIEHRHALRQSFRSSALSVLLGVLSSEMNSVSVATAGIPSRIAQTRYSRAFEEEADDFAIALLLARKRRPELLGTCLQRIAPSPEEPSVWRFLSTHPH